MKSHNGFSFLELLIIFIILAVLTAIAVPSYINYQHRLYYKETIIAVTENYKTGVQECFDELKILKGCSAGKNHVPTVKLTKEISSLSIVDGVISLTPKAAEGIQESDNYILTPKPVKKKLVWAASGGAITNGYADE